MPNDTPPEWALKIARALSVQFGAETTAAQRDETFQNIARALVAVHEIANDDREMRQLDLIELRIAFLEYQTKTMNAVSKEKSIGDHLIRSAQHALADWFATRGIVLVGLKE